tara:strand:+ start:2816 stop:3742 length:927 start_codon:yes stop_codon:yes gene_type:complete
MTNFNNSRKFGVEIEFPTQGAGLYPTAAETNRVVNNLLDAGVPAHSASYGQHLRTVAPVGWEVTMDGTVGFEIVSPPIKGQAAKEQIEAVCRVLNEMGYKPSLAGGLHVHHGAEDLNAKQLKSVAMTYANHQTLINQFVAKSRRTGNQWCKLINYTSTANYNEAELDCEPRSNGYTSWDKYQTVNLNAYVLHGTIEFRQHQGTINAAKIWNWVVFTQMFVERALSARQMPAPVGSKPITPIKFLTQALGGASDDITKEAIRFQQTRRNAFIKAAGGAMAKENGVIMRQRRVAGSENYQSVRDGYQSVL